MRLRRPADLHRARSGYHGYQHPLHRCRSPQCRQSDDHLFFDANVWHAELPCPRTSLASLEH
jgi:hypothetical protein